MLNCVFTKHQSSWHIINLVDTIIISLLSKDMIVPGHNSCWGTNVSGHKHAWAQSCLGTMRVGTNVCGHNHDWAQTCLGPNVVEPGFSIIFGITMGLFPIAPRRPAHKAGWLPMGAGSSCNWRRVLRKALKSG